MPTEAKVVIPPAALTEPWTDMNPWTNEYLQRELATMQSLEPFGGKNGLKLDLPKMLGVMRCYMRQDFIEWGPSPRLTEGDTVWMTMTPQEIESQYMPIYLADGRVGIGGLGLGYATARIASKPNVTEVVVYETNPTIIALFHRNFGQDVPKVRIVEKDVATIRGESFDLFFNDVYAQMWEDNTWEHWNILTDWNDIGWYHPWGIEAYMMALIMELRGHEIPFSWRYSYFPFLKKLIDAVNPDDREPGDEPHGVLDVEVDFPAIEAVDKDLASLRPDLWADAV